MKTIKIAKIIFLIFLIFSFCGLNKCFAAPATSQQNAEEKAIKLYTEGNLSYKNKDFASAAKSYEAILRIPLCSWEIYYNLGNANFRMGEYATAILNYERAAKLSPNNKEIQHNLLVCQTKIADKTEQLPSFFLFAVWQKIVKLLALSTWAILSLVVFAMLFACLLVFLWGKSYSIRKKAFFGTSTLGFIFIFFILSAITARENLLKKYAIITANKIEIKDAPESDAKTLYILHEGSKVAILDYIEPYYKIKIGDGNRGWIPSTAIEQI